MLNRGSWFAEGHVQFVIMQLMQSTGAVSVSGWRRTRKRRARRRGWRLRIMTLLLWMRRCLHAHGRAVASLSAQENCGKTLPIRPRDGGSYPRISLVELLYSTGDPTERPPVRQAYEGEDTGPPWDTARRSSDQRPVLHRVGTHDAPERVTEDVGVVAVVEPALQFLQIAVHVLDAHLVERSDDAALEQAPDEVTPESWTPDLWVDCAVQPSR